MSLSRNILKLFSGRIAIQFLNFLTVPIVTRLFLPDHFGVIQLFDSFAIIFVAISGLKYDVSIPLAKNDQDAFVSLTLSLLITSGMTVVLLFIIILFKNMLAARLHAVELETFLWFLPVVVFTGGLGQALTQWASRQGHFGVIVASDLSQSLPERFIQILWGFSFEASAMGLFVARLVGIAIRLSVLLSLQKATLCVKTNMKALSSKRLWTIATHYKKLPIFTSGAMFMNRTASQLIHFFLGTHFSTTVLGYYSLGYRTVRFPINLLSTSVERVFFPEAARQYTHHGTLVPIVEKTLTRLIQIGVFPVSAVCLFGPTLFTVFYGQQWSIAGTYAQITSIWTLFVFFNSPLKIFLLTDRQGTSFFLNILSLLGMLLGLSLGTQFASPYVTIGVIVGINVLITLVKLTWKLRLARVSLRWALKLFLKYLAIACGLLAPGRQVLAISNNPLIFLGFLGGASLIYGLVLLKLDPSLKEFLS